MCKGGSMKALILVSVSILFLATVLMPRSAAPSQGSPKDILIIANNAVPQNRATVADVRNYFLKKQSNWSGGVKVVPVNVKAQALRDDFRQKVLQMSATEETRYWQNLKITKGLTPPAEFSNAQKAVFKLKGSVSYVYRADYTAGVSKILLTIPAS